ncbi:MAG: Pyrimidine-nucleoside phosphorylase [Ignavibacteriae bacterium]|nr:MAG: Pyrimidine-nucleoside phosphorylase [Ignavibacteriota bacterium]
MNPVEIIRKKRDKQKLTREEMEFFIKGYVDGKIPDYQMSAFLMAIYFNKMDFDETVVFTDIMLNSGVVVDLSDIPGVKVDKHSTGGIGDKVSIILAPMVASCGVPVPMISGRGLGHTGGTLDKLDSIPGFRTNLSLGEYKEVISKIGIVMIGQTKEIAPADKKMYALRDVTGTVECIPLIAGSIMSKKLAEGIDALVLDIKTGRGAFMQSKEDAIELAKTLIAIGNRFGKKTIGFLTDMSQPLGNAVGNWLEIAECVECLRGKDVPDLMEVTYLLGGAMLMLGKKASSIEDGIKICKEAITSGRAYKKFLEMVEHQGGKKEYIEELSKYPKSKYSKSIVSKSDGDIVKIDALEVGLVGIILGAGRMKVDDVIDPKAGIVFYKKVGDSVEKGDTIAILYCDDEEKLKQAEKRLERAILVATEPCTPPKLIYAMIDEMGIHEWKQ